MTETTPHRASHRASPNLTLTVLAVAGAAYAALSSMVVPALPSIQHSLGATESGVTWLLTGYLLSASVATSIIGRLGDMMGKEKVLLWTLVILAGGTLLGALATSLGVMILARVIQGAGGGIFPLAFGIVRDEFPREKVAGSIGILSSILGVGAGIGIVLAGVIIQHLSYHWLYWIPLIVIVAAAIGTWRYVPESPVRMPGRINWLAAVLMSIGISVILIAVSETISWGWTSPKTLGVLAVGVVFCIAWVWVEVHSREPLIDMKMMRIRGVWTTNTAAFLLGAGMYASFIVFPQFAQLPKSTGFGFGASTLVSGFYLLPATLGMMLLGTVAGTISHRWGSKTAFLIGTVFTTAAFGLLAITHSHPFDLLISAGLLGIGMGLAFAALGNLIVSAVPPEQTGVASGMNTVMRTLGGALGGQLSATFIANNVLHGLPTVTGFEDTFLMATGFLAASFCAGLLVPGTASLRSRTSTAKAARTLAHPHDA